MYPIPNSNEESAKMGLLSLTSILASPKPLYTASVVSFLIARLIIHRVKAHGPIPLAHTIIKYNSILYSILSLLLLLAIISSQWKDLSQASSSFSLKSAICSASNSELDTKLRYLYHASKIYEYVDIFNVLAAGGVVNAHFGVHHFTVRPPFSSSLFPHFHFSLSIIV
jgi:hypothetical protein